MPKKKRSVDRTLFTEKYNLLSPAFRIALTNTGAVSQHDGVYLYS